MKNPIKTFGPNMLGRDFAIGDLHGSLPALLTLLEGINFDFDKDRLFSPGDLVDRGPDSLGCLRLMREPWFHCTLSNHEQMMHQAFHGGRMGQYWTMNGGEWGWDALLALKARKEGSDLDADDKMTPEIADIFSLVDMVDELPYLITVNNRNGKKFHIIHAELPPAESAHVTDEMLADPATVMELAKSKSGDGDAFLWARSVWYGFYNRTVTKEQVVRDVKEHGLAESMNPDRSMVISGHTILQRPITILGLTNIDTGAYASCKESAPPWAGLTCINLDTWEFYKATPTSFEVVDPITVNKCDLENNGEAQDETDPRS